MDNTKGFDMSKMSTASKILLGAGILLFLDSFILSWQKVCVDFGGLTGLAGAGSVCAKANAWSGNGSLFGVLMGLLCLALIVWEGIQVAGQSIDLGGQPASKISAYLGFATVIFGLLKFLLVISNSASLGAWVGIVLIVAIAYGSWMRFQEPAVAATGMGGTMGGGTTGGTPGGTPPPPPPTAPPGDSGGFTS
jgi:hypothetical protein